MKINLFGYEIGIQKESETLSKRGATAKKDQSWKAIRTALDTIENQGLKYSEYRVQQLSKKSINTVKKYRSEIEEYREQNSRSLF